MKKSWLKIIGVILFVVIALGTILAGIRIFKNTPSDTSSVAQDSESPEDQISGTEVHVHYFYVVKETLPTCGGTSVGQRTYECSCGETREQQLAAKDTHSFANGLCDHCDFDLSSLDDTMRYGSVEYDGTSEALQEGFYRILYDDVDSLGASIYLMDGYTVSGFSLAEAEISEECATMCVVNGRVYATLSMIIGIGDEAHILTADNIFFSVQGKGNWFNVYVNTDVVRFENEDGSLTVEGKIRVEPMEGTTLDKVMEK